ncbi:MAG TPA: ScyD/ScyE family protein [Candidatus Limnocylindrales bacterium]
MSSRRAIGAVVAVTASLLLIPAAPAVAAEPEVVFSGLDNPRGLAFGPDGALYVAEAGSGGAGPCFTGPEGEVCFGLSGSLTRFKNGEQIRVLMDLPSIAAPDGTQALGASDVSFGKLGYLTIGLGGDPNMRADLPEGGQDMAKLFSFVPGKSTTLKPVADIGDFEAEANPDGGVLDTNPQSVLARDGFTVVADAGGNALLKVGKNGKIKTLAVFPQRMVDAPPFLELPPGTQIPMDAVPTGVAFHEGAYYVAQLTGFPFPKGGANIFKVVPGQDPEVFASGLTNLIDIAFDGYGDLYALEIADNTLLGEQPSGMLLRIHPGQAPEVIASNLMMPGGLAIKDGFAYVTDCGTCVEAGRVLKIKL